MRVGLVDQSQFIRDKTHREIIDHRMLRRDQHDMFVVLNAQQCHAEQRAGGQIEAPAGFLERKSVDFGFPLRLRNLPQIENRNLDFERRLDDLRRMSIRHCKRGAQHFMPLNDLVECARQELGIERSLQDETSPAHSRSGFPGSADRAPRTFPDQAMWGGRILPPPQRGSRSCRDEFRIFQGVHFTRTWGSLAVI